MHPGIHRSMYVYSQVLTYMGYFTKWTNLSSNCETIIALYDFSLVYIIGITRYKLN